MRRKELHVVIGGGVAGCLSALFRRQAGFDVILLEKAHSLAEGVFPVCTQTSNIVSENHSGAEYPFDPQSAKDCLDGRIANESFFPDFIYGGKEYSRIIASRSMIEDGIDILGQCRQNIRLLSDHYRQRCEESPVNRVFGDPGSICRELPTIDGVRDVAGAFVTPQRGMNPVLVATLLEAELRRFGVDLRDGCEVESVAREKDGRYSVRYSTGPGQPAATIRADQVSLCSGAFSFAIAKRLRPDIQFPRIYMALRLILYVTLPDGTEKNFTCLKLEHQYGGMLSPVNEDSAMVYYPPAAHVMNAVLDENDAAYPIDYSNFFTFGHPEQDDRSRETLTRLRSYYPELERSEILSTHLKVAINTVSDSRMRRNLGVFEVMPGCSMTVLPKWTMCVVNARQEFDLVMAQCQRSGNVEPEEADQFRSEVRRFRLEVPMEWKLRPERVTPRAAQHAANMRVPGILARSMRQPVAMSETHA